MDYQKNIDTFFKLKSSFIIEQFQSYKNDSRNFTYAIDKIRSILSDERSHSIININRELFTNCIFDFNHFERLYQKGTSISLVIENEIKFEFEKIQNNKILDENNNVVTNYSFDKFINDLIEYDSLGRIESRLSINSELYKLFYNTDDYDEFTIEYFEDHVINSNLYRNLYSKNYPNKPIPYAVKRIDDSLNTVYDIIENSEELTVPVINSETKDKIRKQTFEIDEQLLILNLCLSDINSIPLTEKIRLIILIGEIEDDSILYESSSNNLVYQKVNKGILRRGSSNTMIDTIDSIKIKIDEFDLLHTKQTLKKHRTTLISEQKRTK